MVDRYTRQRRLAEVGDSGQARIAAARFSVGETEEAWSEREYLERAGAGAVTSVAALELEPFAHATAFRHLASQRLGAGSWRALVALRRTLAGVT
jgi:hypothetical protein